MDDRAEQLAALGLRILEAHDRQFQHPKTTWREGEEWRLYDICHGRHDDYSGCVGETETWDWIRRISTKGMNFDPPAKLSSPLRQEQRPDYVTEYGRLAALVRQLRTMSSHMGGWFVGRPGSAVFVSFPEASEERHAFKRQTKSRVGLAM